MNSPKTPIFKAIQRLSKIKIHERLSPPCKSRSRKLQRSDIFVEAGPLETSQAPAERHAHVPNLCRSAGACRESEPDKLYKYAAPSGASGHWTRAERISNLFFDILINQAQPISESLARGVQNAARRPVVSWFRHRAASGLAP